MCGWSLFCCHNIDLFKVMSIVYDMNKDRQERKRLLEMYEQHTVIDESVINVVAATTKISINYNKAGEQKMCTLWDEVREEGREEGHEAGISEGLSRGREIEIFMSVQEGDYGVKRGAEKLAITEAEFIERMEKTGYKLPTLA